MALAMTNLYYLSLDKASPKSSSLIDVSNWVINIYGFFSKLDSTLRSRFGFCSDSKIRPQADAERPCPKPRTEEEKAPELEVCRQDVEIVMGRMGLSCSPEDGKLQEKWSSEELSNLFGEEEPTLDEVEEAFSVFDQNRDGFIDAEELQRVLRSLGFKQGFGVEDCKKMIRTFDADGDGRIGVDEFVKFMEASFC